MRRADKLNYTRLEPIEIINLSPLATASESSTSQATKPGPFCKSLCPISFSFSTQKESCDRREQMSGGGRVTSRSFKINYVTAQHRWQQILNTCKSLLKHPKCEERMIYFDIRYSHIFFFTPNDFSIILLLRERPLHVVAYGGGITEYIGT